MLLSEREYKCEKCGLVIDRDLNAAINLKNYGLNKLRAVSPEVTPVEMEALACNNTSETTVDEAGISACTEMYM